MTPQQTRAIAADASAGASSPPRVFLPHTGFALTEAALGEAVRMARDLDARITVLVVRIVPFPELLDPTLGCPGLSRLMQLAEGAGAPVTINIVYARDWETACEQVLDRGSLVVIAIHRGWLRSREKRLAQWLVRTGHKVTTVPV